MVGSLINKHCVPCEGWMPPLTHEQIKSLSAQVIDWQVLDDKRIEKDFKFKNFKEALDFINRVGRIAEKEGHHPDIALHNWNKVKFSLTTHAIKGLSENDFILAANIDHLYSKLDYET